MTDGASATVALAGADGVLDVVVESSRRTRSRRRGADLTLALWDGIGGGWFSERGFAKINGELREPFRSDAVDFARQPWCRAVKHLPRGSLTVHPISKRESEVLFKLGI